MTRAVLIAMVLFASTPANAQSPEAAALHHERIEAGRGHLWRNLAVGSVSLVGGTALTLASDRDGDPFRWGFGIQTAIWGAIDVGIAVTGLIVLRDSKPPKDRIVVRKEQLYHDILLFNMGLDIAYMSVGTTLVVASYHGLDNPREWRGHGTAIIIQGAALLSLETFEWTRTRRRLRRLRPVVSVDPAGGFGIGLAGAL